MSESTKIVPRSMTLGLGFSSPEDPDEFGKDMWAVRKMLHSSGHLLGLYIHARYVSPGGVYSGHLVAHGERTHVCVKQPLRFPAVRND